MLPLETSQVHAELIRTELININFKKTKLILFNPCTSIDFLPSLELGDHELEVVEEMWLLGLTILLNQLSPNLNPNNNPTKAGLRVKVVGV